MEEPVGPSCTRRFVRASCSGVQLTPQRVPLRLFEDNLAGLGSPSRSRLLRWVVFADGRIDARKRGKAVRIGHGPATVIGPKRENPLTAESQNTDPNQSKLTLSARESVARCLALFARLFYFAGECFGVCGKNVATCGAGRLRCAIAVAGAGAAPCIGAWRAAVARLRMVRRLHAQREW